MLSLKINNNSSKCFAAIQNLPTFVENTDWYEEIGYSVFGDAGNWVQER